MPLQSPRWEARELISSRLDRRRGSHDDDDIDAELYDEKEWDYAHVSLGQTRSQQAVRYLRSLFGAHSRHAPRYRRLALSPRLSRSPHRRLGRRWKRYLLLALALVPTVLIILILITGICLPSYTRAPARYNTIRDKVRSSQTLGRANTNNEKIFIATSIYDQGGELVSGAWGEALLNLIDLLGPDNVFLSLYENDIDSEAQARLDAFAPRVTSDSSIVSEHLDISDLPVVSLPDGRQSIKRIAFLAKVRNRALAPLNDPASPASAIDFDKVLYVNDVVFNPVDAANLLFSTNADANGKTQYRAACAADFSNPFKYYDTFATRDLEGYSLGLPFFPWFPNSGNAYSRHDVLAQRDAVRVRSCWGGMVAFDARFFQNKTRFLPSPATHTTGTLVTATPTGLGDNTRTVRFRSDLDPFWDGSECCLVHADIQDARGEDTSAPTGIYLNPYIRVAYDTKTLAWLPFTRRFERLYPLIHRILNWYLSMPGYNPRRTEEAGQQVVDRVWMYDYEAWRQTGNVTGEYQDVERTAIPGGFCGSRKFLGLPDSQSGGRWFHYDGPLDPGDPSGKGRPVHPKDGFVMR